MPPQEHLEQPPQGQGAAGEVNPSPVGEEPKLKLEFERQRQQQAQLKDVDFDDLLPHVGEFGTYQKILFVLMIPFAFFVAWVYFSQIFITLVPEQHWCRVPELDDLPLEKRIRP